MPREAASGRSSVDLRRAPRRGLRTCWRAGGKATKIDAMTAQSFPPPIEDLLLERADPRARRRSVCSPGIARPLGSGPCRLPGHRLHLDPDDRRAPSASLGRGESLPHLGGAAGMLACLGGARGRRAAVDGLAAVGVSSAVVNVGLKQLAERTRPDRDSAGVIRPRHTAMPRSSSFPSGHSASGFAFATAIGREIPTLAIPLRVLAAAVAYSALSTRESTTPGTSW